MTDPSHSLYSRRFQVTAGHRSPRHSTVLPSTVNRIRRQHNLKHSEKLAHPHVIAGYLRPYQLAERLQIQPYWIYERIRNGTIKIKTHAEYNAFLFPDVPQTLEKLRRLLNGLGFIELTIPDKPQSNNQKMRITEKGRAWLAQSTK